MPISPPALNALRVFEVAARHMSFTRASEELNISQAAVSQRIKSLEAQLGKPLFHRHAKSLFLTDVAKAYLPLVRDGLTRLDSATEQLFESGDRTLLTVRATAGLATLWLAPLLQEFQARHPNIDLRVITAAYADDLPKEPALDIEIRYGSGGWSGLQVDRLLDVEVFPVCAPALSEVLRQPTDLGKFDLLHVVGYGEDWHSWLQTAGAEGIDPSRGVQVDASVTALQMAQEGAGIALGRSPLVTGLIEAGRLIAPFDVALTLPQAYYLVCPVEIAQRPSVMAFREWIIEKAGAGRSSN